MKLDLKVTLKIYSVKYISNKIHFTSHKVLLRSVFRWGSIVTLEIKLMDSVQ